MKILRTLAVVSVYLCVATVIAQTVAAGVMAGKGLLSRDRMVDVLAAFYQIDLAEMRANVMAKGNEDGDVQVIYEEVLQRRVLASLDIDLRETAIEKSMGELQNLRNDVVVQRERHEQVRRTFENRLQELQQDAASAAIQKALQAMEKMQPKMAKDQLLRMVDDGDMPHVVAIMNAMAPDKLKKVMIEFKSEDERSTLYEILREVRSGRGQSQLLEGTRNQLDAVDGQQPKP